MIINHNMNAVNAHRNMMSNINHAGKSMEKLSSGLRINRAGDDAAGLAISEKMRGQIRGLDQAARNSQDGISMIQTAEGALNETHSILQRMRELSTQAANDTNTSKDRDQIQNEVNQLTSEINRIGNTTEFNTQKVLDGGAAAKAAETDKAEPKMQAVATGIKLDTAGLAAITTDTVVKINDKEVTVKGVAGTGYTDIDTLKTAVQKGIDDAGVEGVTVGVKDGVLTLTSEKDIKVEDKAADSAKTLGLKADTTKAEEVKEAPVEAKEATGAAVTGTKLATASLATLDDLKINGTKVALTNVKLLTTGGDDADKVAAALQKDIDAVADLKGKFTVSKNEAGGVDIKTVATGADATLKLEDGSKTELAKLGLKAADVKGTDEVKAEVNEFSATLQIGANKGQAFKITIKDMRSEALGISKKVEAGEDGEAEEPTAATAKAAQAGADSAAKLSFDAGVDNGAKANDVKIVISKTVSTTVDDPKAEYKDGTVTITLGKTQTNNTAVKIQEAIAGLKEQGEVDFSKFKVTGEGNFANATGAAVPTADVSFTLAGGVDKKEADDAETTFAKTGDVTNGTTADIEETALDMSSHLSATAAIEVLDTAINTVSTERSKLGAYQNRLEHTINNLGTSSENLTAAESRVRDVDMAKEMMTFSKDNILQQAAQAMLAQAKQQPQGVLQLLR